MLRHHILVPLQQALDESQAVYDSDPQWAQHETPEGYLVRSLLWPQPAEVAWCRDLLPELAAGKESMPGRSSLITRAQGATCCISCRALSSH